MASEADSLQLLRSWVGQMGWDKVEAGLFSVTPDWARLAMIEDGAEGVEDGGGFEWVFGGHILRVERGGDGRVGSVVDEDSGEVWWDAEQNKVGAKTSDAAQLDGAPR